MAVRDTHQRIQDVRRMLETEVDAWVASTDDSGEPYLIPLSFAWTGSQLIMAAPASSRTVRNLHRGGQTRVGIGPTRDVVMIDATVSIESPAPSDPRWDVHAEQAGFDARSSDPAYALIVLNPVRIQAWRNPAELAGRTVYQNGAWLEDAGQSV